MVHGTLYEPLHEPFHGNDPFSAQMLYLVAAHIDTPDQMVYLRLAQVNRLFYAVFMSDTFWQKFNVYRIEGVARHFLRTIADFNEQPLWLPARGRRHFTLPLLPSSLYSKAFAERIKIRLLHGRDELLPPLCEKHWTSLDTARDVLWTGYSLVDLPLQWSHESATDWIAKSWPLLVWVPQQWRSSHPFDNGCYTVHQALTL